DGSHALQACFFGFHMASLWEIFNLTTLDYGFPGLDFRQDDSGFGPPTLVQGWIRTGYFSAGNSAVAGLDNCFAWTSNSASNNGPAAQLPTIWSAPSTIISPWQASFVPCSIPRPVWCVENRSPSP